MRHYDAITLKINMETANAKLVSTSRIELLNDTMIHTVDMYKRKMTFYMVPTHESLVAKLVTVRLLKRNFHFHFKNITN